jgi:hypothetical protein
MNKVKKYEDFNKIEEKFDKYGLYIFDDPDNYDERLLDQFRTKLEELVNDYTESLGKQGIVMGLEDIRSNLLD